MEDDFITGTDAEFGEVVKKDEEVRNSIRRSHSKRKSFDVITSIISIFDRSDSEHGDDSNLNDDAIGRTRSDFSPESISHDVEEGPNDDGHEEEQATPGVSNINVVEHDVNTTIRLLKVPSPGIKVLLEEAVNNDDANANSATTRLIFPECAICLNEYKVDERISWSQEDDCDHAFHETCILRWFLTLSSREDARQQRRSYEVECNLHCPMCRQDFIASPSNALSRNSISE